MAERFGDSSPDGDNTKNHSGDIGLSGNHHADIQPPLTKETHDCNVHPVQHQDGCHAPDQLIQTPERLPQWEEDHYTRQEHTQLKSLYGLCLRQVEELKTQSLYTFLVEMQTNDQQAQRLSGRSFGQNQGQDQHEVLYKDQGSSEVSGGGLGHRVPQVYQHAALHVQPTHNPLLNPEESKQDIAQQPEDREDKLDQSLSGDQVVPAADRDPQVPQADSDRSATVAGHLSNQSPAAVLPPHHGLSAKPDPGLCLEPAPPGDPTQALPQGDNQQPLLAQVTLWMRARVSDTSGASGDEAGGSGGSTPTLVITQAEEVSKDTGPDGK